MNDSTTEGDEKSPKFPRAGEVEIALVEETETSPAKTHGCVVIPVWRRAPFKERCSDGFEGCQICGLKMSVA